ncbi:hypothetical protein Tco_0502084 [Tanacetum coccineum]
MSLCRETILEDGPCSSRCKELIFNVESTSKYPQKHGNKSINQIDIIDTACEDHFNEVLNVQKSIHPLSGSPTLFSDPIVASLYPSLTPFGDSNFLLEETDAFLSLDDLTPPEIDNGIYDSEGDILFLEKLLNDDPTKNLPPKELKNDETKMIKSSIEEPPELELKDLPPHLEYAFLEGTSKLPVVIAKDLKREEKDQLNSYEDIDSLVPILRVSEKPFDSLDPISKTFNITIINPLFDFDSEFSLNSDNPIFDIQNEESDESETETIMEEVQIHSSQSTAQIPPPSHRDDVSCGSQFLTRGGGCPMIACHVAVLTAYYVQVADNDWYEVAEVAGRLANKGVTRVHGDEVAVLADA